MAVTLRVYDAGEKYAHCADRYSLYYPTPRNKVKDWGYKGIYLGFGFSENEICEYSHGECKIGVGVDFFGGKKIKRQTLPTHVQKWIDNMEKAYNKAIKTDTEEGWEEFNEMVAEYW